jgi:hypothetical protein
MKSKRNAVASVIANRLADGGSHHYLGAASSSGPAIQRYASGKSSQLRQREQEQLALE